MSEKSKMLKVNISYGNPILLSVGDLNEFQGDLKELTDEASDKLKGEIKETGFAFAPHAWLNPKDKKWMLLDGHQRVAVLRRLKADGYQIPKIPTIPVKAKSFDEAKRRVLQGVSQYGHVTQQGLYEFINAANMKIDDVVSSFDMPSIDLEAFKSSFFGNAESNSKTGASEITEGEIASRLIHTCPKCGHEFQ